jgi:hypothetical protein
VGITLKSDSNKTILIKVEKTKELKIVVNVFAPENVTLKWYGPQGSQLHPDVEKYDIKSDQNQTVLKVFNTNLHDAGIYTLHAYNSNGKASLKRLVIVQGENLFTVYPKPCLSSEEWLLDMVLELWCGCNFPIFP